MFDFPDAKRVCREDIKTPPSSRSPSPSNSLPDIRAIDALQHVYSPLATFIDPTDTPHTKVEQDQEDLEHAAAEGSEEQEFEFRLFYSRASRAGPAADNSETASTKQTRQLNKKEEEASSNGDRGNTTDGIQKLKIRLRSLSPGQAGEGGFVVPFRGWDYYLSDPEMVMRVLDGGHRHNDAEGSGDVNSHVRGEFIDVAVSGEEVLAGAKSSRWPGCSLPWRVIHAQHTAAANKSMMSKAQQSPAEPTQMTTKKKKKKKKPGKKRRIILRKRTASKAVADEADREKRTRRNREKKIKRRQKERDKKAAMRDAATSADGGEEDQDESSS